MSKVTATPTWYPGQLLRVVYPFSMFSTGAEQEQKQKVGELVTLVGISEVVLPSGHKYTATWFLTSRGLLVVGNWHYYGPFLLPQGEGKGDVLAVEPVE
jgi:hypothetical protein